MKRSSGVLMHVSSLPGKYSCGAFGKEAERFIDLLSESGYSYWQVLPFCIPDECASPYKSYSAFAGNPYFIDLDELVDTGLLTREEADGAIQRTPYVCEFERLGKERTALLSIAARRAKEREDIASEIDAFISSHGQLASFCEFMARKEANGGKAWYEWDESIGFDISVEFVWKFIQYEFFREWNKIRNYANSKGVKIIGDIPIYVSHDSADVWANRSQFKLTKDGMPSALAGCPPDYFAKDGQLWGNPLYDWNRMKKDGYAWWSERMEHMLGMFDGVRIDHFRGLESYWSIPAGAKTAAEGKWVKGPGKPFIDMLRKITADHSSALIIAEDLGDITKEVEELVEYSGFPGMRVLQFAFLGDKNSPHLPHNFKKNCVAYTGTHDNNTLLGFLWECDMMSKKRLMEYCGYYGNDLDECAGYVKRAMLSSHSDLVIFPIQDILVYGKDTRMNIPGRADGNWAFRLTSEQLEKIDRAKERANNELYSRCD